MIYEGVRTASPHRDGMPSAGNKAHTRTAPVAQALDRMAATTIFRFCMDIVSREHSRSPTGLEPLFRVSADMFLQKHPFANIWRAIHYLNSPCKAVIQKTNAVDVDDVDFVHVQNCWLSDVIYFILEINDVRRSKITGQIESRLMVLLSPLDFQCHCRSPLPHDSNRRPSRIDPAPNAANQYVFSASKGRRSPISKHDLGERLTISRG